MKQLPREINMPIRNTQESWGSLTRVFHWLIALLVLIMLLLGASMEEFAKPTRSILMQIHKSIGLTVFLLMILRLCWRLINPTPHLPLTTPRWQKRAARGSHALLYFALIFMPLSGWIMSTAGGHTTRFWWLFVIKASWIPESKTLSHFASDIHLLLAWTITGLLIIHIGAALKHHFVDKDGVINRMMP